MSKEKMVPELELKRNLMIEVALVKGFHSPSVIKLSEELDMLILLSMEQEK